MINTGHIVETYHLPSGVTVHICDDAYINKTPEQLQQVRDRINRRVTNILIRQQAKATGTAG